MITFVAALVVGTRVMPLGSANRDESTYVAMAQMIEDGRLTLPAGQMPFRPWASGVRDGRIVMKYTPPWPAALAAADAATGSLRVAPALAAAVAVVLVYLLAAEVLHDRRRAMVAAALFAASPFVLVQAATYLSYVFQVALELGFAVLFLTGARGAPRAGARMAAAGLLIGVAAYARTYDAIIFAVPVFGAVAWGRPWRAPARWAAHLAAGAAAPAAAFLVTNAVTMGAPTKLPFTVTGPSDVLGFGRRGVFPQFAVPFRFGDGVSALVANLGWLGLWGAGGPVLVVLAVLGLRGRLRDPGGRAMLAVLVVVPLALVPFWGSYAVVHYWAGAASLGPFYHLIVLVPMVVLAAEGAGRLVARARRPRPVALALVAAMATVSVALMIRPIERNLDVTRRYRAAERAARAAPPRSLLVLPERGSVGFESWTPFLLNRPDLDQPVLYAEDRDAGNFATLDRYPARTALRVVQEGDRRSLPARFELRRLERQRGRTLEVAVDVRAPSGAQAYLRGTGAEQVRSLGSGAGTERLVWRIGAPGSGAEVTVPDDLGVLAVGVVSEPPGRRPRRWEVRIPYRVVGGQLELLRPGRSWRRVGRVWRELSVDAVVREVPPSP